MGAVTNPDFVAGCVWRLHCGDQEIARLTVTGTDMPWVYATVDALPGFERFRSVFAEQEQAIGKEDWDRADACYEEIRSLLTMTFPDGRPVSEFMVHVHGDGRAGWRWHAQPFEGPRTH